MSLTLVLSPILSALRRVFSPASLFANGEQGVWYDPSDLTTMFQDAAGTTPVTTVEQPVGLLLDKSKNVTSYSNYFDGIGDDLSTPSISIALNQDFTLEGWFTPLATVFTSNLFIIGGGWNTADGLTVANFSNNGFAVSVGTTFNAGISPVLVNNNPYHVAISRQGSSVRCFVNGSLQATLSTNAAITGIFGIGKAGAAPFNSTQLNGLVSNVRLVIGTALYTSAFTPSKTPLTAISGTAILTCQSTSLVDNSVNNYTITKSGNVAISYAHPFGNHATQSTSTSRPVLSARYNLLLATQTMTGGLWASNGTTDTTGQADAYGGTNAVLVTASAGVANHSKLYGFFTTTSVSNKYYIEVKAGTQRYLGLYCGDTSGATFGCTVDLQSGTITATGVINAGVYTSSSIENLGNGWYGVTISGSSFNVSNAIYISAVNSSAFTTDRLGGAANGSGTWYVAYPDLRTSNISTGIYKTQRVTTATDYDTDATKFPKYLKFDGVDDSMATASVNFTTTDKMTVWSGVRKLSDAAIGILIETGPDVSSASYPGSLAVYSPNGAGVASYQSLFRGDVGRVFETLSSYAAPITNVLTVQMFNQLPAAGDGILSRINGVAITATESNNITDAGVFGNYPLYIGRRAGATLPYNGQIYSLIIRGAASTATQITNTETYVNSKTKAY